MTDTSTYSIEERLVVSVWAHERTHTKKTMKNVQEDFQIRFNKESPPKRTIMRWEQKLFATGSILDKTRTGRPSKREEKCAAVAISIQTSPETSLRKRSAELGISKTTLLRHLREDLKLKPVVKSSTNASSGPPLEPFSLGPSCPLPEEG